MVLIHVHRFPNKHPPHTHNPPQTKSPIPRATCPNDINHPHAIHPNETVRAAPMCPPERSHSGVSIPKHTHCARGMNDGCAHAGRRGRAHRHRPYQSPLYIRVQSSPTTSTTQTKCVNNLTQQSGAEMHRALPPPFFKTSCVCKLASR